MNKDSATLSSVIVSLLAVAAMPAQAADPSAGRQVFTSTCSICHSNQPNRNGVGPSLFGVVGRKSADVPGYGFSPAMQGAKLTWDEATLEKYLESPRTVVPGTKMTYAGLQDPTKRADLIAYLATLK
jgi:cytochrome c